MLFRFAKEVDATFNACGAESIATIVDEIMLNLCAGDYAIEDHCWEGGTHTIYVTLDYDAPNSSCANPPILE